MAYHEYGRRRFAEGHFPAVNSFAMLRQHELRDSVDHPERYRAVLEEREALFAEVAALQEPFIVYREKPDMSTYRRRGEGAVELASVGDVIQGVPGCSGKATGIARIVTDAHDPSSLEPGDVLVAPSTDPSWTPLFVPACAVVVDVGAPLSHAIIVSRELGNPCVVSATDATKRIPDGATIEVDGDTGAVTILALP
jgi:pyruvate,water dikinase